MRRRKPRPARAHPCQLRGCDEAPAHVFDFARVERDGACARVAAKAAAEAGDGALLVAALSVACGFGRLRSLAVDAGVAMGAREPVLEDPCAIEEATRKRRGR